MMTARRAQAVAAVSTYLTTRGARTAALHPEWIVDLTVLGQPHPVLVVLPPGFPFERPVVFATGERETAEKMRLTIPHTNIDGTLCVSPNEATFDPDDPVGVLQETLRAATALLTDWKNGKRQEDFHDEANAFWPNSRPGLLVDVPPGHKDCSLHWWEEPSAFTAYVSVDEYRLKRVIRSRGHTSPESFKSAFFFNLSGIVLPKDYPKDTRAFLDFVQQRGGDIAPLLEAIRARLTAVVIMRFPARRGAESPIPIEIGALLVPQRSAPPAEGSPALEENPGTPQTYQFVRLRVQRIDSGWLHFRGGSGAATQELFTKKICLLGCGALGSQVAVALAREGIKHLTLVDPDELTWDNIGRHVLGAGQVTQRKATALAQFLEIAYPDLHIRPSPSNWQGALSSDPAFFGRFDLVISATGAWAANAELNLQLFGRYPVQYLWAEPYGAAGHSLVITGLGGCLACGFDRTGVFQHRVFHWPNPTLVKLPGCGGAFQPFGASDAASIASMAVRHTLDYLGGKCPTSELRVWVNRMAATPGAELTPRWQDAVSALPSGIGVLRTPWNHEPACNLCE